MRRWLLTVGSVLLLVTIGGQCRGSMAQQRVLASLTKDDPHPVPRTTPMTATEWARQYDYCLSEGKTPVIMASRSPVVSLGVACASTED